MTKFNVGDKVSHKKFGEGEVKGIHESELTYDVRFPFPTGYEYEIPESKLKMI